MKFQEGQRVRLNQRHGYFPEGAEGKVTEIEYGCCGTYVEVDFDQEVAHVRHWSFNSGTAEEKLEII